MIENFSGVFVLWGVVYFGLPTITH